MSNKWIGQLSRVTLALIIASALSIGGAWLSFWGSAYLFAYLYPYDGQDVLGAIVVGFLGGVLTWILGFYVVLNWRTIASRRHLPPPPPPIEARSAEQTYTITGRPV